MAKGSGGGGRTSGASRPTKSSPKSRAVGGTDTVEIDPVLDRVFRTSTGGYTTLRNQQETSRRAAEYKAMDARRPPANEAKMTRRLSAIYAKYPTGTRELSRKDRAEVDRLASRLGAESFSRWVRSR